MIPGKIDPSTGGVFSVLSFRIKIFADLASSIIFSSEAFKKTISSYPASVISLNGKRVPE